MDWNIVSAIGTVLAAFVGVAGIWINFWDKHRKLNIKFELIPNAKLYISNNSQRTVAITKLLFCVKDHIFFAEYFDGLKEIYLQPATTTSFSINKKDVYNSYFQHQTETFCNLNENVNIILYDNYDRKHMVKTFFSIESFKE